MRARRCASWLLAALTVVSGAHSPKASAAAEPQATDHPLVGRFQGAQIVKQASSQFTSYPLLTRKVSRGDQSRSVQNIEGKLTQTAYKTAKELSTLDVVRAYEDALKAKGFELLFQCEGNDCGGRDFNHASSARRFDNGRFAENYVEQRYLAARLQRSEGDVYAAIQTIRNTSSGGSDKDKIFTLVDVIEVQARASKVEVIGAEHMAADIGRQGHIALYGIYFDTDKADVKPQSRPTLQEIATLLKTAPALRLHVVGHTDNQGALAHNVDLSKRRADAVVQALVRDFGIAAARLAGHGVAFLTPVAPNKSEEGRAKNRRVELVEQ